MLVESVVRHSHNACRRFAEESLDPDGGIHTLRVMDVNVIAGWVRLLTVFFVVAGPVAAAGQKTSMPRPGSGAAPPRSNELTPAEQATGWKLLFNGKTLAGWRGVGLDSVPTGHWRVIDGTITRTAARPGSAATENSDLMTVGLYLDFELSWEWRIQPAGNSGVKYDVAEDLSVQQASPYAALGFEYQLLDDSLADDNALPSHRTGALFDLVAPNDSKRLHPPGEWNRSTVIVRGGHGEHWLNGELILSYELGTPAMDSALARSKFRSIRGFAEHRAGHIVLQDHGDSVSFRNLKIRPIEPASPHGAAPTIHRLPGGVRGAAGAGNGGTGGLRHRSRLHGNVGLLRPLG